MLILLDLFFRALFTVLNQDYIEYSFNWPPCCTWWNQEWYEAKKSTGGQYWFLEDQKVYWYINNKYWLKELIQHWTHFWCYTRDDHGINLSEFIIILRIGQCIDKRELNFFQTTTFQAFLNTLLKEKQNKANSWSRLAD